MMRKILWVALALVLSTSAFAQPFRKRVEAPSAPLSAVDQTLWNLYFKAIYDSSVYQQVNLRQLRPLVPDSNGNILGATLTSRNGTVGQPLPSGNGGIWITGVPEVQDICRGWTGDIPMRLRELIGLPPDADIPRVITLQVQASDVFRPAVDPTITTTYPCSVPAGGPIPKDCGNVFPTNTSPAHYAWMASSAFSLHEVPDGYPWTHLGYTYNWAPGQDRYGASEYVIRTGAQPIIMAITTPEQYCAPATSASVH
jgi:hypothetical protein